MEAWEQTAPQSPRQRSVVLSLLPILEAKFLFPFPWLSMKEKCLETADVGIFGHFLPVNCPPVRYIETYTQLKPEQCHETCGTRSPNQTLSLIRSEVISRDMVDKPVPRFLFFRGTGFVF